MPHFLEPQLPLPAVHETLHHLRDAAARRLGRARAGRPRRAPRSCSAARPSRVERLRARFAGLHRWLSGKYFIDELYERVIGRPLVWISDRVFLRLGDRGLLDGTLNGLAALGRGSAGVLGRLQTGSLHLYAWFVLVGIVGALLWSWRHV